MITGATVTVIGDASVGIPDHQFTVDHLDFDLDALDPKDHPAALQELRDSLKRVGKILHGEDNIVVFLHGVDEIEHLENER